MYVCQSSKKVAGISAIQNEFIAKRGQSSSVIGKTILLGVSRINSGIVEAYTATMMLLSLPLLVLYCY